MNLFDVHIQDTDAVYRQVRDNPKLADCREFAELLWSRFAPFADSNFRSAIAHSFHQRFWEMYLGYALLQRGACLRPSGRTAPDIRLEIGTVTVWIEAVAPTAGSGPDAVPPMNSDRAQRIPTDEKVLRLRGAIEEKHRKYLEYRRLKVVGDADPFIIAVNARGIPDMLFDSDPPYIIKAVFPLGDAYITFDRTTRERVDQGYHHRDVIQKKSGAPVSTTVFCNPAYSGVSAILYCNSDIVMRPPDPADIGNDFTWIPNPLATNRVSSGAIPWTRAYLVENGELWRVSHD